MATLPHYSRFVNNINLWIVISLFKLPSTLVVSFLTKFVSVLCLAVLYWKGSCLPMTVCSNALTLKYECQMWGGSKLVNQMIHGMWNIRHQKERTCFFHVACVCAFNCVKCNKSLSVLNRQTVVLRCPEGLHHEQCRHQSVDV